VPALVVQLRREDGDDERDDLPFPFSGCASIGPTVCTSEDR
jgi:hypothetical protein